MFLCRNIDCQFYGKQFVEYLWCDFLLGSVSGHFLEHVLWPVFLVYFFPADERADSDPAAWHSIWQEGRDKGFSGTVSVPDRNIYHNVSDRTGAVRNRSSFTGNASAVDFLFTGVHCVWERKRKKDNSCLCFARCAGVSCRGVYFIVFPEKSTMTAKMGQIM